MSILAPYFKKYKWLVFLTLITIVINVAATLWQPKLLQQVIEAIFDDQIGRVDSLGTQLLAIAGIGLISAIANTILAAKITQNASSDLREDAYRKIQTYSYSNVESFSTSGLVVRLTNDIQQIQNLLMMIFQTLLRVPFILVGAFIFALTTLPNYWWVIVGMVVIVSIISAFVFLRMGPEISKIQNLIERGNTIAKENLQGVRVVKSFNQENSEQEKFNIQSNVQTRVNINIGWLYAIIYPAFMFVGQMAIALAIYLVSQKVRSDPQQLAQLTSYINYLMQVLMSIVIGGLMITNSSRGFVSAGRIKEVMETKPDVNFFETDHIQDLKGSVEFENVSFGYPNSDQKTLNNISFQAQAGQTVAVVGATGSGKSTLIQLIARLYDPSSGTIKIGGFDLKNLSQKTLQENIAYVLQKPIMFSGSIASNLKQGKKDASLQQMQTAAEIAQASEFIDKYQDNYQHQVDERSANFSGGQKQRLSIARGIIGNPKILILDDSTSALDAKSERLVKEALTTKLKNTTKFIIAEKISSVIDADLILVMDDGQIVNQGTHRQLIQNSPIYNQIYQTQRAQESLGDDNLSLENQLPGESL